GIAYVYDEDLQFPRLCNQDMVSLEAPDKPEDAQTIRRMLESHLKYTGSARAKEILDNWDTAIKRFVKVMPNDYRRVLDNLAEMERRANLLSQRQGAKV
ncbi:MAG: gltB, partial [Phycisphaerales bacterium]|nr:gltB [Phycisphaerales bacterium]